MVERMRIFGRNGFTVDEIAAHVGSTYHAVRHVLWKNKISTSNKHNRRRNYKLRSLIVVSLRLGMSCRAIAKQGPYALSQVLSIVRQMVRDGLILQQRWPNGTHRYVVGHDALFLSEVKDMSFEDCQLFVLAGGAYHEARSYLAPQHHLAFAQWYVDDKRVPNLAKKATILGTGNGCKCGGVLVRTGTCETCQSCGESSGCG